MNYRLPGRQPDNGTNISQVPEVFRISEEKWSPEARFCHRRNFRELKNLGKMTRALKNLLING